MRRVRQTGFTLLELILVMLIICIVMAMASPSLRGWSRASALRDAGDELLAFTRMARTQAVTTCKTHRLCVEPGVGYYLAVLEGREYVPVASDFGHPSELPQGISVELVKLQESQDAQGQQGVNFFPTGRTEVAKFRVISEQAGVIEIACASPAEVFEVVSSGDGY